MTSAHSEFISATISDVALSSRFVSSTIVDGRLAQITKLTSDNHLTVYIYEKNSSVVHATLITDMELSGGYVMGSGRPYITWNENGRYGLVGCMAYNGSNYIYRIKRFDYNRSLNNYVFETGYADIPTPGLTAENPMKDHVLCRSHTDVNQRDIWYCIYTYYQSSNWVLYSCCFAIDPTTTTITMATTSRDQTLNIGDFNEGVFVGKTIGYNSGIVIGIVDIFRAFRVIHFQPYTSSGVSSIITYTTLNNKPYSTEISSSSSPDVRLTSGSPLYYTGCFDIKNNVKYQSNGTNQNYDFDFEVLWSHRESSNTDIRTCWARVRYNGTLTPDISYNPPYYSSIRLDLMGENVISGYKRRFFNSAVQSSTNTTYPGVAYNKKANVWLLFCNANSGGGIYCFLDGDTYEPLNLNIQGMNKPYSNAPFYLQNDLSIGGGLYCSLVSSDDTIYNCYTNGWQAFTNLRYAT